MNVTLGALFSEWLPHLFATLFVGLSAGILAKTLRSNFEALQRAHTNERRFREIARVARHMFMIVDSGFRILYSNRALQEIIGYSQEEIALHNIKPTVHPEDEKTHRSKLRYLRDTPKSSICSRLRVKHRDGRWIWLEARGYNMLHDDAICGLVFSIEDISARKDAELKLEEEQRLLQHLAMHDPLTGLPNRRYLLEMVAGRQEDAYVARVRVTGSGAGALRRLADSEVDGELTIGYNDVEWLARRVAAAGSSARVLSPPELVDAVVARLGAAVGEGRS